MATKKKTKKKATKKKTSKKKAAVTVKSVKAIKEKMTQTDMYRYMAEAAGIEIKQAKAVVQAQTDLMAGHLHKNGVGVMNFFGLIKLKTIVKPATKARKGINPFTGEPTVFKAKPKRILVKALALKKTKEMV